MKFKTRGMAFRVWFYFMTLTSITLLSLWMLQISFIRPYYERNRYQNIQQKALELERFLEQEDALENQEQLNKILAKENICGSIYSQEGELRLYSSGSTVCVINNLSKNSVIQYIDMAKNASTKQFTIRFNNDVFDQGLHFYAKEVLIGEDYYYLFLNAPIELLDSTVFVLRRQFALLALIVFTVATLVSFILSQHLTRPIENLTQSALDLADGDLDVKFQGDGYHEIDTLAKTLNFATEEFKKTDDLRRDLVANVSHDYKTPLTMIRAYAEMIRDISGDNPKKREEHLQVILDEVDHLELLVNDMLTLSKYESQMYVLKPKNFNLFEHIQKQISLLDFTDWLICIDCPKDLEVYADEVKMGQVLMNYLNNALKYAYQDKRLSISVQDKSNKIYVYVEDFGPGLNQHEAEQIWDRYYKVDKNYQRHYAQSGLGLSIVKAICEANKSSFGVVNKEGDGACFYYSLEKSKGVK